jgi:uncharacterized damage-inducible protein DinB
MSIAQSMLPEFDHEMASTRKTLERIPDNKLEWKAHPKSNTIGWVAAHLANIPSWTGYTLNQDSLDLNPPDGKKVTSPELKSIKAILDKFDENVVAARKSLSEVSDADFLKPWSLLDGGKTVLTMPRVGVIRTFVLNHSIHHRAILTVYLRLNDIPVPALYGPSGDENG